MSTPTWPVPYYQRLFRHPVNSGDIDKGTLENIAIECNDSHALLAKETLRANNLGYVVEAVENHADTTTYCTKFEDSTMFTKAYTDDLLNCLGVAWNENRRIMAEHDLQDVWK